MHTCNPDHVRIIRSMARRIVYKKYPHVIRGEKEDLVKDLEQAGWEAAITHPTYGQFKTIPIRSVRNMMYQELFYFCFQCSYRGKESQIGIRSFDITNIPITIEGCAQSSACADITEKIAQRLMNNKQPKKQAVKVLNHMLLIEGEPAIAKDIREIKVDHTHYFNCRKEIRSIARELLGS
jgi:hypothetical protein